MTDLEKECQALRHMVGSLASCVRELAEQGMQTVVVERLNRALNDWHAHRSERFAQQVEDAEAVLEKASQVGDYGLVGSPDKFVSQKVAVRLREELCQRDQEVHDGRVQDRR